MSTIINIDDMGSEQNQHQRTSSFSTNSSLQEYQCEETSLAAADIRGSNYGLLADYRQHSFTSKYKNRAKMLATVLLIVGLIAGGGAYIGSSSHTQEVYMPHDTGHPDIPKLTISQNQAADSDPHTLVLKSSVKLPPSPQAQPLKQFSDSKAPAPEAETPTGPTSAMTSDVTKPKPAQVMKDHNNNDTAIKQQSKSTSLAVVDNPKNTEGDGEQMQKDAPVPQSQFNPKAVCVLNEQKDPKSSTELKEGWRMMHPRNLLQEMFECPTFTVYECKKHIDRKKLQLVGFKSVLNVRSAGNEFIGYGKNKKSANKEASKRAVAQFYNKPYEFNEDDSTIGGLARDSNCTIV